MPSEHVELEVEPASDLLQKRCFDGCNHGALKEMDLESFSMMTVPTDTTCCQHAKLLSKKLKKSLNPTP